MSFISLGTCQIHRPHASYICCFLGLGLNKYEYTACAPGDHEEIFPRCQASCGWEPRRSAQQSGSADSSTTNQKPATDSRQIIGQSEARESRSVRIRGRYQREGSSATNQRLVKKSRQFSSQSESSTREKVEQQPSTTDKLDYQLIRGHYQREERASPNQRPPQREYRASTNQRSCSREKTEHHPIRGHQREHRASSNQSQRQRESRSATY